MYLCIYTLFPGKHCLVAQDIHFSQYNASPLNLNPALAGNFDGDYRLVGNQRNQWRSVTTPYNTFGVSVDAKKLFNKPLSGGFSVYNDKAGDSQFGTLQILIAGGYSIPVKPKHYLTLGLQSGFTQRKINYENLNFDSQYNGSYYDPNLGSGESFSRSAFSFFNLNSGITWTYEPENRKRLVTGISIHNITKPQQTFFSNNTIRLDRRISVFAAGQVKLTEKLDLLPGGLLMDQGKYREYLVGTSLKHILNDVPGAYRALYYGIWFRTRDAGFFSLGMDYNNLNVGISYDINVSDLTPASNYRGGFEVSVIYILRKIVPYNIKRPNCPTFI